MADFKTTKVNNSSDVTINPATEDTLSSVISENIHTTNDEVRVFLEDLYLSNNSTTTPLGISETWTGTSVDTLGYGSICYSYISDKATATNGLYVEFSDDNTNWDKRIVNTYDAAHANEVTDLAIRPHSRYMRMGIINGTQEQTYVRLHTTLRRNNPGYDTMGVDHAPVSGDDALLTKSVIAGQTTAGGGSYVNVKVNPSGSLSVSVGDSALPSGAATSSNQTNGTQKTQLVNSNGDNFQDSLYPESLVQIPLEHHRIHDGRSYTYDDVITLGNGATQNYLLTTDGGTNHFGYVIEGIYGITVELFAAADRTGTTLQTSYNRNRIVGTAPTMTIHKGYSSGSTDGTRIKWKKSGSGTSAGKLQGSSTENTEFILNTNTKYIVRITSAAASNDISVTFNWYTT